MEDAVITGPKTIPLDEALDRSTLRTGSLSFPEVIGHSVANMAPTVTPALQIALVAGFAGLGTWLSFLIATIGVVLVAANIGVLARRHPLAGSYFVYIGRTLGAYPGMMAGLCMLSTYISLTAVCVFGGSIFLDNTLTALGLAKLNPPLDLFIPVFTAIAWFCAYRDVRLSSRISLITEGISMAIIVIVTAIVVIKHGTIIDAKQLDISSMSFGGVTTALALSVLSFVGFESAATLAQEARDPRKSVPRSILLSAIIGGGFFVIIAYCMVMGMGDDTSAIASSASPFVDMTKRAGLGQAAAVVYAAATFGMFAASVACFTAVSRLMFSLARYGVLHTILGRVHLQHQTPHVAVSLAAALVVVICYALSAIAAPMDAFGYAGTFSVFGCVVVYLLMSVVAPLSLWKTTEMKFGHVVLGVCGVVLMAFVLFTSVYPAPPAPYSYIPYLFLGYLVLGSLWYLAVSRHGEHVKNGLAYDLEV
jgi:amino acid transporter